MRLAICGPGRSGKDTAALFLKEHTTLRYEGSTSEAAAKLCFAQLSHKYGYSSVEEAFADRHNHRVEWAEIIWNFNKPDGVTLYEDMLKDSDVLNGIRRSGELDAMRDRYDDLLVLWLDRETPVDPSLEMGIEVADIVVRNRGTVDDFHKRLWRFARAIGILR